MLALEEQDLSSAIDDILGGAVEPGTAELAILPLTPAPKPKTPSFISQKHLRYVDEIDDAYIESITNRDTLKTALSQATGAKAQRFLAELVNPKNSNKKLTRLARKAGIDPLEIEKILRSHALSTALTTYTLSAPKIAADITADSRSIPDICPRCEGAGGIRSNPEADLIQCPRCGGEGHVRLPGSTDARKIMAEAVGWTKRGGPLVAVQVNTNTSVSTSSVIDEMEELVPSNESIIDITPENE